MQDELDGQFTEGQETQLQKERRLTAQAEARRARDVREHDELVASTRAELFNSNFENNSHQLEFHSTAQQKN